jgi:hypothetical protein
MSILLDTFMQRLRSMISRHSLENEEVSVFARPLSPEEAIGNPAHDDYPLLKGKERMMQAVFQDTYGQAYSDQTGNFSGSLSQIVGLTMDSNFHRALVVSTANAVLRKLGVISKSCHCRDEDPITCASRLFDSLLPYSPRRIGMIGMQPRLLEALARDFEVRVCDRDPDKIGTVHAGVLVEDSDAHKEIKGWADLLFATGTTLVNDTIDLYVGEVPVVFFGVTISGAARALNLNHFCPLAR